MLEAEWGECTLIGHVLYFLVKQEGGGRNKRQIRVHVALVTNEHEDMRS